MPLHPVIASLLFLVPNAQNEGGLRWPDQLADPLWKPKIGYLRPGTGLVGERLIGPTLKLLKPSGEVKWSLSHAPSGMKIDDSNRLVWDSPVAGQLVVHVTAQYRGGSEEAEWWLNIIKATMPDSVVHSTRHMDYIVPRSYGEWLTSSGADGVIDRYYEFGRDLVGGLPTDGRQGLFCDSTDFGAYAHSGNPIVSSPFTIGDEGVGHWRLGFLFHELGHNLNGWTRVDALQHDDATMDKLLHGMVEFDKMSWVSRMLRSPETQGVKDAPKFVEQMMLESIETIDGRHEYEAYAEKGGGLLDYKDGMVDGWQGWVHTYAMTYGPDAIANCIRAIRTDGVSLEEYLKEAHSTTDRMTILLCIMSHASGHNLLDFLHRTGMPINDGLYARLDPLIGKEMENLPALGKNGAFQCPVDGHYYCVTPYGMSWAQSEAIARRMGGHLATIRSADQEKWLARKFGVRGYLWVGFRKDSLDGVWKWVTQEKTAAPIWEPERPEKDPSMKCAVLILHEENDKPWWFGLANRHADEGRIGIIELDHAPAVDFDGLP